MGGNSEEKSFLGITLWHEGGHLWVVDQYVKAEVQSYQVNTITNEIRKGNISTTEYLHCNWGWAGSCNGYFCNGIFDANNKPVMQPDMTRSDVDGYYQYNLEMLVNIKP